MKKSRLLRAVYALMFCLIAASANAELHGRFPITPGGTDYQAAYDDVLDITWVTNGALSEKVSWQPQVDWAANLDYLGFDDWRLASMSVTGGLPTGEAPSVVSCNSATEVACRDNELGYMFYQNMGGTIGDTLTGNQTVDSVQLSNVQGGFWSGTEYETDPAGAWFFTFIAYPGGHYGVDPNKGSGFSGWAVRDGDVGVPVEIITIDIKPGSDSNSINLKSKGVIPVAILMTDTFDATQVDWDTVSFGPDGATESHGRSHVNDVDGDGDMDVVLHFKTQETGIDCDDTEATLTGETFGGEAIQGSDSFTVKPCQRFAYEIGYPGPAGGIVFYLDGMGGGLEGAPVPQGRVAWGCLNTDISGADGTMIGAGEQNTADILAGCTESNTAAAIADSYVLNGFTDWFLPSRDELDALADLYYWGVWDCEPFPDWCGAGSNGPNYWSSSEYDSGFAWARHRQVLVANKYPKDTTRWVFAVRAF